MAVMPREAWTDDRLDDLAKRVDRGFDRVDTRFDRADARFDHIDAEFGKVRTEIVQLGTEMRAETNQIWRAVDARFDALNRNMFIALVTVIAALIGSGAF